MSTLLKTIENSGKKSTPLTIIRFYGGTKRGQMLQLTQGFAGSILTPTHDEPGFIQLTESDVNETISILNAWLDGEYDNI